MKKIFFSTLLVALTAVLMTGCKKDDDGNGGGTLVGRWEAVTLQKLKGNEWKLKQEYSVGESILELSDDGRVEFFNKGLLNGTGFYAYNDSQQKLTLLNTVYTVESLTSTELVVTYVKYEYDWEQDSDYWDSDKTDDTDDTDNTVRRERTYKATYRRVENYTAKQEGDELIGRWSQVSEYSDQNGKWVKTSFKEDERVWEFAADGTVALYDEGKKTDSGSYSYNFAKKQLKMPDREYEVATLTMMDLEVRIISRKTNLITKRLIFRKTAGR